MVFEPLADYIQLVVLAPDDALCELLDEVQVAAPCGQYVFLAYTASHLVGIVVAHEAEVGIYRGAQLLKQGDSPGMCVGHVVELHHGGDEMAACTV